MTDDDGRGGDRSREADRDAAARADRLRELHDHLAATGELPVERSASHYLGEAEAVVADALGPEVSGAVVRERVEQARDLLSHVEETGDERADERVAAARALCGELLEELEPDSN